MKTEQAVGQMFNKYAINGLLSASINFFLNADIKLKFSQFSITGN